MAADNNASVEFTLQMAFKKEIISVEHTSLTMSSLIDIACVFIDEKFPDHRQRDLKSCINLFHHNLNSDNLLSLITNTNSNILQNSLLEVVLIDKTDSSSALKIQPHQLNVHSYKSPHFCDYCDVMLFGLIQQGLKCAGCGMNFHKRCAYKIPNNCQRTRSKRVKDCNSSYSGSISASIFSNSPSTSSSSTASIVSSDPAAANLNDNASATSTPGSSFSSSAASASVNSPTSAGATNGSIVATSPCSRRQINGRPIEIEPDVHNRIKIPHTFVIHSYKRPTVCKYCKNLLYGIYKQGYRCKDCYFNCHKKCAPLVPKNCQGEIEVNKPDEIIDDDDSTDEISSNLTPSTNVPLQRLVESIRRPNRSHLTANIVKECWMLHFTNTKHERYSYYWRVSTKNISWYLTEKHKKPLKEIAMSSIKNIMISKDPQAIDATRNPHIFEIDIDSNQTLYVGENLPASLTSSHASSCKTSSESSSLLSSGGLKSSSSKSSRNSTGTNENATLTTQVKGSGKQAALTLHLSILTAIRANQDTVDQPKEMELNKVATITEETVEKRDVEKYYKMYYDDVLGSGQFGTVFGGVHRVSNKEVAIKIIEKIRFNNKYEMELKNEVIILQNLKHSGVVNLDEMFETPNKIFIVMEKLHGDMLEVILNSEMKRFPERLTKFFISQILVALRYLHSKCIVHCDLKPENVLLASDAEFPQIKLCDFGFARIIGEKSFRRSVQGTPAYLPPEVLQSKGYNRSLDMWSVGVIVYVSLSGTFPFNDDEEIVEQITNASFMYPPNPWNTLSKDATEIVRQLLNVNTLARLTVVGGLRHSWISEDYQLWADLRILEKKTNERYLTNPLDDERWEKYYEKNNLDHWSVVGQTRLSNCDYELHHYNHGNEHGNRRSDDPNNDRDTAYDNQDTTC